MARPEAHRKFYDFSEGILESEKTEENGDSSVDLMKYVSKNVIGNNKIFSSPFGTRKGEL